MQSQRKIREQPHVALTVWECGRNRKSVGQKPAVVRFAEKIATQQLQGVGGALHFSDHMFNKISAAVRHVGQARMREMELIATVRKKRNNQNESGQQRGCGDAKEAFKRPVT